MICKYCGKETQTNDGFCEHCEAYVGNPNATPAKPAPALKICKSCFSKIDKNHFYCPVCGKIADTAPAPQTSSTYSTSNSNESEGSFWLGFLLGFVLGVIGIIIALCLNQSETKRGAIKGLVVSLIIGVVLGLFYGCVLLGALSMLDVVPFLI